MQRCFYRMQKQNAGIVFFFSVSSPKLLGLLLLDVKCKNIQLTFRSTVNFIIIHICTYKHRFM